MTRDQEKVQNLSHEIYTVKVSLVLPVIVLEIYRKELINKHLVNNCCVISL